MKSLRFSRKQLGIPYAIFLLVFVIFPLLLIILYAFTKVDPNGSLELSGVKVSFTLANFIEFFSKSSNIRVLFISIGLAVVTTVICLLIAYPLAYILARSNLNKSGVLLILFVLPMWINFVLRAMAMKDLLTLIGVFGFNNYLNVIIGMVYDYFPYMILPIYSIMAKMDIKLLEAARDLGCNGFGVLKRVIFPLSLPGVISGITMVLIPSISTFYISQKLGNGKFFLIGDAIEGQYIANNLHFAAAIAFILMVILLVCMGVVKYFTSKTYGGE